LALTGSYWTGAAEALHSFKLQNIASTTVDESGRLAFSWDATELMSLDSTGNLAVDGKITLGTADTGTTDSVITREVSGDLTARSIDSRVWGSSLVDGAGTTGYVSYWSDA